MEQKFQAEQMVRVESSAGLCQLTTRGMLSRRANEKQDTAMTAKATTNATKNILRAYTRIGRKFGRSTATNVAKVKKILSRIKTERKTLLNRRMRVHPGGTNARDTAVRSL